MNQILGPQFLTRACTITCGTTLPAASHIPKSEVADVEIFKIAIYHKLLNQTLLTLVTDQIPPTSLVTAS